MRLTAIFFMGSSALALAAPALGQTSQSLTPPAAEPSATTDAEPVATTNDIVVTARRREESVQDVPQTVNVVTAAQIDKLNLRNFTEIQSVVPGLTMEANSAFSNRATVRGISFVPEASGSNPSVEFYLNDAPISSGFLFQSTFDFGQFELQRGPQGTLRGRASPSGAIAVTTRRPDLSEPGMVVNGTLSTQAAHKLDGAFNFPVIKDVLAVRLAGVIDDTRSSYTKTIKASANPTLEPDPYRHTRAYRASIRFEPTDWISANLMYQDLTSRDHNYGQVISASLVDGSVASSSVSGGFDYTPVIRASDRLSIDDQGGYSRQHQQVLIGNLDLRFAGQRLSYVGAYSKQEFHVLAQQDGGDFFNPVRGIAIAERLPVDPAGYDQVCARGAALQQGLLNTGAYDQCTHTISKQNSHELRLQSEERLGGIFDYVVGGFYNHTDVPTNLTQETPVVLSTAAPVRLLTVSRTAILRRGNTTEKSVFGNLTAHLLEDRFELSGGLRYIDYKDVSSLLQGNAAGTTCPGLMVNCVTLTSNVSKDNATIYTGSAKFKITPDIMIYAQTGSSWRPGPRVVGDFSVAQTALEQSFLSLPPEKSKSYEIGLKTAFAQRRGRFNISVYRQTFENYPFRSPFGVFYINSAPVTANGVTTIVPSVSSFNFVSPVPVTVKGVEGELSFTFSDRFSIGANASYADGKIKNGRVACNDLNRDGVPDVSAPTPTLAVLQAAVGPGQTISACSGINRPSIATPKFSANVQAEVNQPLSGDTQVFLRGLLTYYGRTSGEPDNANDQVGNYALLNLFAGIRSEDGRWEVTGFVKNVFNQTRILNVAPTLQSTSVRTAVAATSFTAPYYAVSVTAPREFGVSARFALGSR